MNTITFTIDADDAIRAFERAHEVMARHVDGALEAGAQYVAREARQRVPKWKNELLNSIRAERAGLPAVFRFRNSSAQRMAAIQPLAWEVRTGVAYARYIEEGVRPMQSHPPGIANGLMEWVRSRFRPENDKELSRIAFAVAFAIQRRGIQPRPYMAPAMEASEARVRQMLRQSVQAGIAEVFGGR
jgi:HK97 gp10 family phage protein